MILYQVKKNNNEQMKETYGKYYALPIITETIGITELAAHMTSHNTGFSPGQVKGILTDMVKCIKELVLNGVAVKIDDLAIFTCGIINKEGARTKEEFTVQKNIESVKLRSRATGELTRAKLNLDASLKDIEKLTKSSTIGSTDDNTDDPTDTDPSIPSNPSDEKDTDTDEGGSSSGGSSSGGGSSSDDGNDVIL